jgi:hypothetical protein
MIVNRTAGDSGREGVRRSQRLSHDADGGRRLWRSQRLHAQSMKAGYLKLFMIVKKTAGAEGGGGRGDLNGFITAADVKISTPLSLLHDSWWSGEMWRSDRFHD